MHSEHLMGETAALGPSDGSRGIGIILQQGKRIEATVLCV